MTGTGDTPRYRLDSRIATGGMGVVWRATDTVLDREVAVKVLKEEYADDAGFRERFAAEARHAAALHHPNVATVFDFGELPPADGSGTPTPFLVMELVPGQPLSALLRDGQPMPPESASALVAQAADAVAAAHGLGVVHRDIKPANLIVTPSGTVKITDFGIARAADSVGLTATGQLVGTPQYLSPEQAAGGTATEASDVYALGVVLYECLAGHRPFDADTPVSTALAHLRQPPPPLPDAVPPNLRAVVERALAKDPRDRYGSAADLAAALRARPVPSVTAPLARRTIDAGVAGAGGAGATAAGAGGAGDRTRVLAGDGAGTTAVPRRPGRPVLPWLLTAAAVLVMVGLLALLDGGHEPGQARQVSGTPGSDASSPVPTPRPDTVRVRSGDYVGLPADRAQRRLEARGLRVARQDWANPDGRPAGTVADVTPVGGLRPHDTVTLSVWQQPPPPAKHEPGPNPKPDEKHDHGKHHGKSKGKHE